MCDSAEFSSAQHRGIMQDPAAFLLDSYTEFGVPPNVEDEIPGVYLYNHFSLHTSAEIKIGNLKSTDCIVRYNRKIVSMWNIDQSELRPPLVLMQLSPRYACRHRPRLLLGSPGAS
jgi:hypothetical protein